ncbi:hypothetical protein HNQ07_000121 [Deinococcus metalli]|uniref:Protein-glutamine gamma-glutamyltransferase-like C-terminal domain-containing protein n=1 Tax=Deinococcus metalli TaxID=1141878 RepID=A0A7W8NQ14_9DEIO|nr:DUF4129 domain-containing protein [Deinococcus metalli]MBB5374677.1 hypothetical protein [Deinococcus metalli]GHF34519.1 hypothetical protein GCM10017781_09200 [Deinococcus metalli]
MTVPAVRAGPETPDTAGWRAYGLALLPLSLAGLLPPAQVALLCGVYALGVRWPEWVQGRLLLGVLAVAGGALLAAPGALSGPSEGVIRLATSTLLGLLAVSLLHVGASRLESGHRSGLLAPLGLGLLAPQALLLPALVGGALARRADDDRPAAWHVAPGPAAWRWPLAVAVVLTAVLALLPRGPSLWDTLVRPGATALAGGPARPQDPLPPSPERPPTTLKTGVTGPPILLTLNRPVLPLELILIAGVVLGASILWRARPRAGGVPPTLVERLMALGLIVGGVVGLASAVLLSRSPDGGGAGSAARSSEEMTGGLLTRAPSFDAPVRTFDFSGVVNVAVALSVLLLAGLTLAAFLARRAEPDPEPLGLDHPDDDVPATPGVPAPPLHRVRRAWRAAEAALDATGRPRLPAESPLAYAARLGRDTPLLSAPLAALARVYAPVRYGAQVTDAGAGTAERALTELRVMIPTLPPPRPPDARGHP